MIYESTERRGYEVEEDSEKLLVKFQEDYYWVGVDSRTEGRHQRTQFRLRLLRRSSYFSLIVDLI